MKVYSADSSLRVLAASLALLMFTACQPKDDGATPSGSDKSDEATSFLTEPSAELAVEVLPHKVDDATEFPAAMESLTSDSRRPEMREPVVEPSNVVRVEKAPSLKKDSPTATKEEQKRIERDWNGTVLVPDGTQMSQAFTTDVRLTRVEAHPLQNGSLRVWVRIANVTDDTLSSKVACNFKSVSNEQLKTAFVPIEIAPHEAVDVYFMSPMPSVISYTVLVR